MSEVNTSREIRKLLDMGWRSKGLPELKLRIKELLSIQESQLIIKEARTREYVGRALSVLFGMFAIPTLSSQIIKPIWEYYDFNRPVTDSAFSVLLLLISLFMVSGIVSWLFHKLRSWDLLVAVGTAADGGTSQVLTYTPNIILSAFLFKHRLRGGEARDRHAVGRAGNVIET